MAEQSASELIRRMLVVSLGVEGAEEVIRALGGVNTAADNAAKSTDKAASSLKGLGRAAANMPRLIASVGAGISSVGVAMRQLGLNGAKDELYQYNKELIASRVYFSRLGVGVNKAEQQIFKLRDSFAFTRDEVIALQKQMQLGFTNVRFEQMPGIMQQLADATGESADKMGELLGTLQQVVEAIPGLEDLIKQDTPEARKYIGQIAKFGRTSGTLGDDAYKKLSGFATAVDNRRGEGTGPSANARADDRTREDYARRQLETIRKLSVTAEEIKLSAAGIMVDKLEGISDAAFKNLDLVSDIGGKLTVITNLLSILGGVGVARGAFSFLGGAGGKGALLTSPLQAAKQGGAAARAGVAGAGALRTGLASIGGKAIGAAGPAAAMAVTAVAAFELGQGLYSAAEALLGFDQHLRDVNKLAAEERQAAMDNANRFSQKYADTEQGGEIARLSKQIAEIEASYSENVASEMNKVSWGNALHNVSFGFLGKHAEERVREDMEPDFRRADGLRKRREQLTQQAEKNMKLQEDEQAAQIKINEIEMARIQINDRLEKGMQAQVGLLQAMQGNYQSILSFASMSGGFMFEGESAAGALASVFDQASVASAVQSTAIQSMQSLLNDGTAIDPSQQVAAYENLLEKLRELDSTGEIDISDELLNMNVGMLTLAEQRALVETELNRVLAERRNNYMIMSQSLSEISKISEGELRRAAAQSSLLATQVSLADNLAMGVGASAQMRFEQVDALQREIEIMREQQAMLQQQAQERAAAMRDAGHSEKEIQAVVYDLQTQRLEIEGKILQKQEQQASVTRTIRDGWVSAISAMMTGEGMFTKIVVDQNKRVGTMMSATENATTGLRTGFAGRGFTESQKYTVGGISGSNDGVTDGWGDALTTSSPLSGYMGTKSAADLGKAFSKYQEDQGRFMGTGAAGAGGARYGTSELLERINDSVQRPVVLETEGPPLPVQVANSAQKIEISVTPQDMKTMVAELIKQFTMVMKTVTEAAQDRVMDEMNTRR